MTNKVKEDGIIRYGNDLADIPLTGMTAAQANIFMVTCYRYQHDLAARFPTREELKNTYQEDIPYAEYNLTDFVRLCGYTKGGPSKFIEDARRVRDRLATFIVTEGMEDVEEVSYPFFHEFVINKAEKTLRVQIHKRAGNMLFNLGREYTIHDLEEFIGVKSIYAKRCYRQLKKWRTTGKWTVDINTFREHIGIPDSYKERNINQRILPVILDQLSPFFKNLKIKKQYGKGRGGPVTGLEFSFKKEPMCPRKEKESGQICPRCGKPLIEKTINGNVCWCHRDGWKDGAECSAIFNSVSDIIEETKRKESEDDRMPEAISARLAECFA